MTDPPPRMDLLDPQALSRLGALEVIATRVVEGMFSGGHRSPHKGSSVEFAEHRLYSPGDELRSIDWRALGRSERYYVKQFEQETDLHVVLVLDASGSMCFGQSTVTKLRYAQMACACLARLLLGQGDSAGLAVIDQRVRAFIPTHSQSSHLRVLLDALERTQAGGETGLATALTELAPRLRRRGMVILLSDAFDDVDRLLTATHLLHARGQELLLLQIMAPEELTFQFSNRRGRGAAGATRFESLEAPGQQIDLDPGAIRPAYLERLNAFLDRLRSGCGEVACDYTLLTTAQPLGEALSFFLARRARRARRAGRAGGAHRDERHRSS